MMNKQTLSKLSFREGMASLVMNIPVEYPKGLLHADKVQNVDIEPVNGRSYDFILAFAANMEDYEKTLTKIQPVLNDTTPLWVGYPKKSGRISSDLSREAISEQAGQHGLRPVSLIAVNNTWSAMRLRAKHLVKDKRNKTLEGIGTVKRTTIAPFDLQSALKAKGLEKVFEALSFTHKKEHIEAIVKAKKAETRARRIQKCLDMLSK